MVMTSYPIIYLDFAANLFSNFGNRSSVFIRAGAAAVGSAKMLLQIG